MTVTQIVSLVVVLILGIAGIALTLWKSKKHTEIKLISTIILVFMALTWIFDFGYFSGATYQNYGSANLGITDIPNLFYYGMNFGGDKIIFLLVLGGFYTILSKSASYKKLVLTLSEKLKGKEIVFALAVSLLFTAMGSLFVQNFAAFIFVPFIISVILNMKLDKITAFSVTFGSILIGIFGNMFGGEGAYYFNFYTGLEYTTGIIYRLIVLVISYILFNLFNVLHIKKTLKDNKVNEVESDPYKIEKLEKSAKAWPIVVIFSLMFIVTILGYINWKGIFGIDWFENFHVWLMGLKISDVEIFSSLLGLAAEKTPFGAWNLFVESAFLGVFSILIALIERIKVADFLESYKEGAKKFAKPIFFLIAVYMIMIVDYMVPVMPTIIDLVFGGIDKINPYLTTLFAFISNAVHTDFGYTGYLVGTFFTSTYTTSAELLQFIFTTTYGFVQLCLPTSAILLIGLSYLDIEYKTWIKYIWQFILGILVIILVLITIIAYI